MSKRAIWEPTASSPAATRSPSVPTYLGGGILGGVLLGYALALGREEGLTKVLFDPETDRILGCGIVGPSAGDLIAEAALAIEMGAYAEDIGLTIHAHPTLSEVVKEAALAVDKRAIHM